MEICAKKKARPELISGHIYQHPNGGIYLYTRDADGLFINLEGGTTWPQRQDKDVTHLKDITDNYCLQEK